VSRSRPGGRLVGGGYLPNGGLRASVFAASLTKMTQPQPFGCADRSLRRQLDRAIGRALVDGNFAAALLAQPTVALGTHECPSPQYSELRSIHASSLHDFARQAWQVFWPISSRGLDATP
jgi:hypothetical protein